MKKFLFVAILFFALQNLNAQVNPSSSYVNGYTKNNGTYVESYYKTTPNRTINDNYSTYPNVNPYTGKQGTVKPDYYYSTPKYNNSIYSTPTYPSRKSSSNKLFDY